MASQMQKIGSYAFLLGVIIAVVVGAASALAVNVPMVAYVPLVMMILGLIIGFLNIKDKHTSDFLIAAIAVSIVGINYGGLMAIDQVIPPVGTLLSTIVLYVAALVGPAALVVGLKQIYALAKEQVM